MGPLSIPLDWYTALDSIALHDTSQHNAPYCGYCDLVLFVHGFVAFHPMHGWRAVKVTYFLAPRNHGDT